MSPTSLKRARSDTDSLDALTPQVKCECRPSPFVDRRLVTSGTKRFAPIPDDCLPSCAGYKQKRLDWVAKCEGELEALYLVSERKLIRDDGLVIDWRSHVPVWSDTLKPDSMDLAATITLAHRSNAQLHRPPVHKESPQKSLTTQGHATSSSPISGDVSDAEPPLKKKVPVPPRPSSKRRSNRSQPIPINSPPDGTGSSTTCPRGPRSRDETEHETTSHPPLGDPMAVLADCIPTSSGLSPQHDQATVPPNPDSSVRDRPTTPYTSSAAEDVMSEMTLNYLGRYVQTYEMDRASLASAYARNASFAYRVHRVDQNISGNASSLRAASPQCFSSGAKRTRLDIVTTLLALPCLHSSGSNSAVAQIEYDILYLGAEVGMFVVCRVVVSTKTVVHNFVLQRKEADVEDAATEGVWPLTATAHQILVFQACVSNNRDMTRV